MRRSAAIFLLLSSGPAFGYRPFDSTDAAVADPGTVEVELAPANWRHNDGGTQWTVPALTVNYGFSDGWELVAEAENTVLDRGGSEVGEVAVSLKTIVRSGGLQGAVGPSLGTEFSVLLPGVGSENGAGLEWTMLASDRQVWGTWHVNLGPMLARDGSVGLVTGAVLEGPWEWPVRPVAEIRYERSGKTEMLAELIGLIIPVRERFSLDIGLRHARDGGRPDEQLRAGITFDLQ